MLMPHAADEQLRSPRRGSAQVKHPQQRRAHAHTQHEIDHERFEAELNAALADPTPRRRHRHAHFITRSAIEVLYELAPAHCQARRRRGAGRPGGPRVARRRPAAKAGSGGDPPGSSEGDGEPAPPPEPTALLTRGAA